MALPFWLPFALMGASTVVNTIAANQQASAIASAMAAENARQREFTEEQFGLWEGMGDRVTDYDARAGERRTSLEDYFTADTEGAAAAASAPAQTALPTSSSSLVQSREASERAEARNYTDQQGRALANMRSFGDTFDTLGNLFERDMGRFGVVQSLRRASQAVLPAELQAAQSRGQGLRTLGDLFSLGSSLTMYPGLMAPAAAATAAPTLAATRPVMRPF